MPSMPSVVTDSPFESYAAQPPASGANARYEAALLQPETRQLIIRSFDFDKCSAQAVGGFAFAVLARSILVFGRIVVQIVEMVAAERAQCPERQAVALHERLANHRHFRAGHPIQKRAIVRQRQS